MSLSGTINIPAINTNERLRNDLQVCGYLYLFNILPFVRHNIPLRERPLVDFLEKKKVFIFNCIGNGFVSLKEFRDALEVVGNFIML